MKLSQFFIFSFISISLFGCVNSHQALKYNTLELPSGVFGPESIAFDCNGDGPYTGISDGRILKWQGSKHGWKEFAITSPFRIPNFCDGSLNLAIEQVCGRPLGLKFNEATCDLYIADAYFGLLVVGQNGGVAKQVAISAEGVPFRFTNALDIDQNTGVVYFTDTSTIFQRWAYAIAMQIGDKTGRLLKYDPRTKEVTVLLRGLSFSNGVALSEDKDFVLVTETTAAKVTRYWTFTQLVGQHGSSHVLHHEEVIPRHPLRIRRRQWNRIHRRRQRRNGLLFPRSTAILPPRQLILTIPLIFFSLGSWSNSYTVRFTPIPRKSLSTTWHMQQEPRLKITTAFSDASFATRSSGSAMTLVASAVV
eukprot:XP_010647214.1 PREDICTED: protein STRICTOSIDINE SYNTHASE-LIKE 10 [Vitis vinifera]